VTTFTTTTFLFSTRTTVSFDCDTRYAHWEYEWSAVKRQWCCQHRGRGCQEGSPTGPTASDLDPSAAMAVAPTESLNSAAAQQVVPSHGAGREGGSCGSTCEWNGQPLGCRAFIAAVIGHPIAGEANMCLAAMSILLEKCPACETCTPADLGCVPRTTQEASTTVATTVLSVMGEAAPTSTAPAGDGVSLGSPWGGAATTTSAMAFDCNDGAMNWRELWSFDKMTWCCQHERVGCLTTSPTPYLNCQAEGLSDEQRVWCCKYKNVGCTPSLLYWTQ
jgi:hypothetical protein